ncbi:HTH-type transcriptional regulator PrtR [Vibrio aerogenes CECT 7868]|uniref:HTH-type transcriptional regulator PrtR n=1 Tax=Vibrio aerogenes CECT 7868 TaxID=1216006 RepID=A0A1M6C1Y9_9VIBR|nr:S24 family peptidase [Vibrio aerogenes]SHI55046.1 HTH-type transcriptional regulator PrtR [Vibrio aerogenes CECT 7868]
MSASERIKQRMQALDLKAVHIVKLTGASKGSVSQWVNGASKPSGRNLIALCKVLQCQPDWLLFGDESAPSGQSEHGNASWLGEMEPWHSQTALSPDEVELPFFTEVALSAGHGMVEVRENHGPKLRFARSTLKRQGVDPGHAACVKVSGNSMEPVLPDGATVGVDTASTTVTDGKMFAIDHDGMLRVKTLYRVPGGGLRIRSFNHEEYPDETYSGDEVQQIRIIGKVFWYSVLV